MLVLSSITIVIRPVRTVAAAAAAAATAAAAAVVVSTRGTRERHWMNRRLQSCVLLKLLLHLL